MLILIVLCVTLFIIIFLCSIKNFNYWTSRGVKQIPPVPLLGNFKGYIFSKMSPGKLIEHFYNYYCEEPYVGLYSFTKPILLIRSPELIRELFIKDFFNFSDKFLKSSFKDEMSNKSVAFVNYPQWKKLRMILEKMFSLSKMKTLFKYMEIITEDLDAHLNSIVPRGSRKDIDIKEICAKYATDIAGLTFFGLNLKSLSNKGSEFRKYGKKLFGEYSRIRSYELTTVYLAPQLTNFFDFRFFERESAEFFKREFKNIFNERESSNLERNDLIDLLLEMKKNDPSISFDDILSQALILFTASYDTTSTVMSFCLMELAKNLHCQEKLRQEIKTGMKDGKITYELVSNLTYLHMIILETLRLYPTVPTIDRVAKKDYMIERTGLKIEKGTPILISLFGLHYDPQYFSDPKTFNPEHFSNTRKRPPAYMPFGVGSRSCIAMNQGLLIAKYGVAHIISKYEINLPDAFSNVRDNRVYFTAGKEGVILNFAERF